MASVTVLIYSDKMMQKEKMSKTRLVMSGDTTLRDIFLDPYSNKTFIYEDTSGDNYYSRNDFENTQNILEWLSDTCNVTITGYFIFSTKRDWMNVC